MRRYIFDRRLPRAPLFSIFFRSEPSTLGAFRLGNHWSIYAWRMNIIIRAPWLAETVRALYPEIYREHV